MINNTENNAEAIVSNFYNTLGWNLEKYITEDAKKFEDLREFAQPYVSKCRLRVLRHIPEQGENILDMASGPIQYREYLEYSKNFKKRYCVDLSSNALEQAKEKIGDHGVFLQGSFFDIPLEENFFDCTVSLHTIYHIDKDKQEEAVRKLLYVTKPGQPVIIVYANPNTFLSVLKTFLRPLINLIKNAGQDSQPDDPSLYYYPHPLEWWNRFQDVATMKTLPWRSFAASEQKLLIPNNRIGQKMFEWLFNLEDGFPKFFVKYFTYPMIILTKKV